ncbi:hypothetical protein ANME2D_01020 [Candidatus Methanoperedens nitroreducens]|uniref:Uncharacterized protein n=1 Tax=Candidatus Methanoperedens nitratireducens TaxID=1392998 RepID=A0A062V0C0_9EURY|nr:hypothetical protein [Candidatus Methanoperedens nitroreducens]KCZ72591.1 hypothetical protein ANME2D_01020 [Candidatus Methanoperedens nitroreducens]MDJ1423477.1 hypothetical protein [Candidatus Methanoperedens sp.]
MADMFAEFAKKTLIENLGATGEDLFLRVMAKKPVDEKSSLDEISEFIMTIERVGLVVSDKDKVNEVDLILRNRLKEVANSMSERENIHNLSAEIEKFLKEHDLPSDKDILDYAKYLALKYKGNAERIERDITERVKTNIKSTVIRERISEEIKGFLTRYPQPEKTDIDDFINYIRLLKLGYSEDELREQIERERLYRKFHGPRDSVETSELNQFINLVKTSDNREAVGKLMQKQGLSYLIKDEEGVSDKSLSELVDLITPDENDTKDMLEEMGLQHMIKRK